MSYFCSYKACSSYLNLHKYFVYFKLLASNTVKSQTEEKINNLLGINFAKYSSKFLAHTKKHLGQTGPLTSYFENNCPKLCGFGVNITRVFFKMGYNEKHFVFEKSSLTPKILSQFFRTNLIYFFLLLTVFFFKLNKTGNEVFCK